MRSFQKSSSVHLPLTDYSLYLTIIINYKQHEYVICIPQILQISFSSQKSWHMLPSESERFHLHPCLCMKKITVTFQCRLTSSGIFSAYKGSMLRGCLGTFLKKTCCTMHHQSCEECILVHSCAFPILFIGKIKTNNKLISLTPPYCIHVTDTGKILYAAGELFTFNITLLSYAVDYLPYFVHAFILAGKKGMGKGGKERNGTFDIENILYHNQSIFHKEKQQIDIPKAEDLFLPYWDASHFGLGTLLVHLKTPCRFKIDNHFSANLSFRQLFQLIVRRIRSVWAMDEENVMFDEFSTMLNSADKIQTIENCLSWKDWTRYSSRQKKSMQLGGVSGIVRYYGDLAAFLPFFILAEQLNIGKQTSFGLGEISFDWMPDEKNSDDIVR